jgi:hypothetical protein
MNVGERLRCLTAGLGPNESVIVSRSTLAELWDLYTDLEARASRGALPPPDLTAKELARRIDLSPSRTRELIAQGEWGEVDAPGGPYHDGSRLRVPWTAVLAREARLRGEGGPETSESPQQQPRRHSRRGTSASPQRRSLREGQAQRLAAARAAE